MSVIIDGIGCDLIGLDEETGSRFLLFDHNTQTRLQGNSGGGRKYHPCSVLVIKWFNEHLNVYPQPAICSKSPQIPPRSAGFSQN